MIVKNSTHLLFHSGPAVVHMNNVGLLSGSRNHIRNNYNLRGNFHTGGDGNVRLQYRLGPADGRTAWVRNLHTSLSPVLLPLPVKRDERVLAPAVDGIRTDNTPLLW